LTVGLMNQFIIILNEIQSKVDEAVGAATALEMRLRLIAELEPMVQTELKTKTSKLYYKADLFHLIYAVINVFSNQLTQSESSKIDIFRESRNKAVHGSLVELMLKLGITPTGRDMVDPHTKTRNILSEGDLVEGVKSIARNQGLETFTRQAREVIKILEDNILRKLELKS
jgi:hypothetical protein